jgi:hypothetical protein
MPALAMEMNVFAGAAGMPGRFSGSTGRHRTGSATAQQTESRLQSVNVTIDGWITRSSHAVCKRG